MRKLKLEIEELAVESFEVERDRGTAGTVRGLAFGDAADAGAVAITVPVTNTCPQVTYCASCVATCDSCVGPSCDSCQITRCATGNSPECCAVIAVA